MTDSDAGAVSRGQRLKQLRATQAATVERMRVLLREPKQIQQAICEFIQEEPKTVPEIAAAVGKPAHQVLWFIAALKKYGIVVETGMRGDYPLYQRLKEKQV